jgi:hypothetical protein
MDVADWDTIVALVDPKVTNPPVVGRPVPVIVTWVPVGPLVGSSEVRMGAGMLGPELTVNGTELLVQAPCRSVIGELPDTPDGTLTVHEVPERLDTVACTPPK